MLRFQSTLPAGGATPPGDDPSGLWHISIHAPRGGSDCPEAAHHGPGIYFNPRSPRGERRAKARMWGFSATFQSTLPAGGATGSLRRRGRQRNISIHAPRGGSDPAPPIWGGPALRFQSTLPAGGATSFSTKVKGVTFPFQSTLPAGGATSICAWRAARESFQSTLPAGGATIPCPRDTDTQEISIHAPRGGSDH